MKSSRAPLRICICGVQVPFVQGGSELLVDSLRRALVAHGHQVAVINLPFKWYPAPEVVTHALAWRMLDLSESQGQPIDLVIATKFPSYLVQHPRKVTWLFHQFRQAYDLYGSAFNELTDTPEDQWVRRTVTRLDRVALPESRAIYTIAQNVSARLEHYSGIASTVLYPPPPLEQRYRCDGYGDFVLSVGRLETIKRVDLLLQALAEDRTGLRCVITGVGPDGPRLQELARALGIEPRVTFAGFVSEEELLRLYATCRSVYYAPYDEDYGFVTLEALRSQKPVVTTADAGGVLEFVRDGQTGLVAPAEPQGIAAALARLADDQTLCQRLGQAGQVAVGDISWDRVVDGLLSAAA